MKSPSPGPDSDSAIPVRERLSGRVNALLESELKGLAVRRKLQPELDGWVAGLELRTLEQLLSLPAPELDTRLRAQLWKLAWQCCAQEGLDPAGGDSRFRAELCFDQTLRVAPAFFGHQPQRGGSQWRRERDDAIQEVQVKLRCGAVVCERFVRQLGKTPDAHFGAFLRQAIRFEFSHVLRLSKGEARTVPLSSEEDADPAFEPTTLPSAYRQLRLQERSAAFERLLERVRAFLGRRYAGAEGAMTAFQLRRLEIQLELLVVLCLHREEQSAALQSLATRFESSEETLRRDLSRLETLVVELARTSPERTLLNLSTGSLGG